jgi:hypothetical protein
MAAYLAGNLGFTFPDVMLLIITISTLIFFARDLNTGFIMLFILTAIEYIIAYTLGFPTLKFIVVLFLTLIAMAFSIYLSSSKSIIN